jgi:hypothetical protein
VSIDPTAPASDNWLWQLILVAIDQGVCIYTWCRTCGGRDFREAVRVEAIEEIANSRRTPTDDEINAEIARALALLPPPVCDEFEFEQAVRLLLFDLYTAVGSSVADHIFAPVLANTWAGDVLARMKAHYARRVEAVRRHEAMHDPEVVARRRAEKKRLKQQQHAERLARKAERDRLWREKQAKEGT